MSHIGQIGPLPLYRPAAVRTADVDAKSIEDAGQRLTMLYPPARNHLRLLLLDPESLGPTSRAIRRLLTGRNAFGHVTLTVITTGGHRPPGAEPPAGPGGHRPPPHA